jgi:hypothetical protein
MVKKMTFDALGRDLLPNEKVAIELLRKRYSHRILTQSAGQQASHARGNANPTNTLGSGQKTTFSQALKMELKRTVGSAGLRQNSGLLKAGAAGVAKKLAKKAV